MMGGAEESGLWYREKVYPLSLCCFLIETPLPPPVAICPSRNTCACFFSTLFGILAPFSKNCTGERVTHNPDLYLSHVLFVKKMEGERERERDSCICAVTSVTLPPYEESELFLSWKLLITFPFHYIGRLLGQIVMNWDQYQRVTVTNPKSRLSFSLGCSLHQWCSHSHILLCVFLNAAPSSKHMLFVF